MGGSASHICFVSVSFFQTEEIEDVSGTEGGIRSIRLLFTGIHLPLPILCGWGIQHYLIHIAFDYVT